MTVESGNVWTGVWYIKSKWLLEENGKCLRRRLKYKCSALSSRSRPGALSLDTGMGPSSWFSVKSSQLRFDRLPIEAGMVPENLLKFKDLQLQISHLVCHPRNQYNNKIYIEISKQRNIAYIDYSKLHIYLSKWHKDSCMWHSKHLIVNLRRIVRWKSIICSTEKKYRGQ